MGGSVGDVFQDAVEIGLGVGTLGVYTSYKAGQDAKSAAEDAAKKQEALANKQQALIDQEKAKQDKVANERKQRLAKNELLSGSETGITDATKGSLLA